MGSSQHRNLPQAYTRALAGVGGASLAALQALEAAERRLHPPRLPKLREQLAPLHRRLADALEEFRRVEAPEGLRPFHQQLEAAVDCLEQAMQAFCASTPGSDAVARILAAMRLRCEAQRLLYPLRRALPPFGRYFVEAPFQDRLESLDPDPPTGVEVGILEASGSAEERGGFTLYIPETYEGSADWPLVVALHGGSGHGSQFVWSWLREARGRRFLLLAPTSIGSTWSFTNPGAEGRALRAILEFVAERYRVDRERILVTGLSDGATFALLWALGEDSPATALAPVSGVLHPANFSLGNLDRAQGRRIYLVHGCLDWLFPIELARLTREALERAGADLVSREIDDLSHTYPREENDRILCWFDPSLALPHSSTSSRSEASPGTPIRNGKP